MAARARSRAERIKLPLWLQWTAATTVGYALGMTLSAALVGGLLTPLGPVLDGILNVLVYGAVIGIFIGLAQIAVMPRRLVSLRIWLIVATVATAIGFAAASITGEALGSLIDPRKSTVVGEAAVALAAGALIGLAPAIPQWRMLQGHVRNPGRWLFASVAGTLVGSLIAATLLGLLEVPFISEIPNTAVGAIAGLSTGLLQGLVLSSNSRESFPVPEVRM